MSIFRSIVVMIIFSGLLVHGKVVSAQTATPAHQPASATTFAPDGIFGCNQTGAYAMSVGSLSAVGGVYVPVNDAAVTLNTGYLVYKECVLRNVINRQREGVAASLAKKTVQQISTGREGRPQYVVDRISEMREDQDRVVEQNQRTMQARNKKPAVIRATTRSYINDNHNPTITDCPYQDTKTVSTRTLLFSVLTDPRCNVLGEVLIEITELDRKRAAALECLEKEWEYGRGFYGRTQTDSNSLCGKILTPSAVVQESFQSIFDSPIRQLENADDIGEIISPLYSSITTQALGDLKGLAGLLQSQSGQPSYLDRMTQEASSGLRTAALNTGIQILNAARQVEAAFLTAKTALATAMTKSITDLRTAEAQCWNMIIERTCSTPLTSSNTCTRTETTTDATGQQTTTFTLRVATSTAASRAIIDREIAPIATQVASDIRTSENAMQQIELLIAGITNTGSVAAQRIALEQLETLVATRVLHNQNDVTQAQKQKDDGLAILQQLVQDTVRSWSDGTDSNVSWCNINNTSVITAWVNRWK